MTHQTLESGVYVPILNFFTQDEEVDYATLEKHIAFLANTGIKGIIFHGSMGEAVHLTDQERVQVIQQGKKYIEKYDASLKVIAGASGQSVRVTLKLIQDASLAGATCALVLPPSFYKPSMDQMALLDYFTKVADQSPIPILIYNYPGVTQGIDIDVDVLTQLAKHKNIIGVKGTEGNIGKVGYLAHYTQGKIIIIVINNFYSMYKLIK